MQTINHFTRLLLCALLSVAATFAQTANPVSQDVTIIIQPEQVRFTSQKPVQMMQLQVFNQTGEKVYDSGPMTIAEINWPLQNTNGEALKSGLYAYTLSMQESGAAESRVQRGHFIVDRAQDRDTKADKLWVTSQNESGIGTDLTVARNENSTVAGTSARSERTSTSRRDSTTRDVTDQRELTNAIKTPKATTEAISGTSGQLAKFISGTDLGNSVITEKNGRIGVGTVNPEFSLHVQGTGVLSSGPGAAFFFRNRETNTATDFWAWYSQGNLARFWRSGVGDLIAIKTDGNMGIGTTPSGYKLDVGGQMRTVRGISNDLVVETTGGTNAWAKMWMITPSQRWNIGTSQAYKGNQFYLHDATTDQVRLTVQPGGGAIAFPIGNVGIGTSAPQATLDVAGQTRTGSLEITGGADFAENFDVYAAPSGSEMATMKVVAGMVVSIDQAHPGKLAISSKAYDRRVAGIISGAGGVNPGMRMSQEGTLAYGHHPVALSGRVYCWVDASRGAIKAGDLLTTSATPGYAMKAQNRTKAQGAILGKAMTSLKAGKGIVLVLVTLQ